MDKELEKMKEEFGIPTVPDEFLEDGEPSETSDAEKLEEGGFGALLMPSEESGELAQKLTQTICKRLTDSDPTTTFFWVVSALDALRGKEKGAILRMLGEALGVLKAPTNTPALSPIQFVVRKQK